jgi:hypothetical protein
MAPTPVHPLDINISPEMESAMRTLTAAGINFDRKSEYHIKVGFINFYPKKGTITVDSLPSILEHGRDAFFELALASKKGHDPRSLVTVASKDRPRASGDTVERLKLIPPKRDE